MDHDGNKKRGPYKKHFVDPGQESRNSRCRTLKHDTQDCPTMEIENDSDGEMDCHVSYNNGNCENVDEQHQDDSEVDKAFFSECDFDEVNRSISDDAESDAEEEPSSDNRPLYEGARVTIASSMLLILTFSMRHALTENALLDLLALVELHCVANNLCRTTLTLFRKFFQDLKNPIEYHYYCDFCYAYIGANKDEDPCQICGKSAWKYFIVIPLFQQLMTILSKRHVQDSLNSRRHRMAGSDVNDVMTGSLYKEHFDEDGFFRGSSAETKAHEVHVSIQLNTDGVSLFNSSKFSVWPVYATINELHPDVRLKRENRLFLGLWFGNTKPITRLLLKPLVDGLKTLYKDGIQMHFEGSLKTLRAILLTTVADAPARCMMNNFTQYNGNYGCPCCYASGETFNIGEGKRCHIYPYDMSEQGKLQGHAPKRTDEETRQHAKEVEQDHLRNKRKETLPKYGVKGFSLLSDIPRYNIIRGCAIDSMHCVYLGVTKMLCSLWFDVAHRNSPWSIKAKVNMVTDRLLHVSPPNFISRMPRSLDDLCRWKASEFRSFLLFYSLPILWDILPKEYYEHYALLVEAIYLLTTVSVSQKDIEKARLLLKQFCITLDTLYSARSYTFNVHCLLHLPDQVEQLGPLWAQSCFFYEDLNGDLRNLFHGSQNIQMQIMTAVCAQQKLQEVIQTLPPYSEAVALYKTITSRHRISDKFQESICPHIYAIGPFKLFEPRPEVLRMLNEMDIETVVLERFLRVRLRHNIIHSKHYRKSQTRRNSETICYGEHKYGLVDYYLRCKTNESKWGHFAVVKKLKVVDNKMTSHPVAQCSQYKRVELTNEVDICEVKQIVTLCVFVHVQENNRIIVIDPPNCYVGN